MAILLFTKLPNKSVVREPGGVVETNISADHIFVKITIIVHVPVSPARSPMSTMGAVIVKKTVVRGNARLRHGACDGIGPAPKQTIDHGACCHHAVHLSLGEYIDET